MAQTTTLQAEHLEETVVAAQDHEHEHEEHRDDLGSKMGMWLFLFTEILLFGGLFIAFAVYRYLHTEDFVTAGHQLDTFIGTVNTIVLITSSFTVAASITALQKGNKDLAMTLVYITIAFALTFMVNKYFEWSHKIEMDLYPGSEGMKALPSGQGMYFMLYYLMTGLHALHVIIGSIFLGFVIRGIKKGTINPDKYVLLENAGLYWHLVDLVWIYLFPLFYLVH